MKEPTPKRQSPNACSPIGLPGPRGRASGNARPPTWSPSSTKSGVARSGGPPSAGSGAPKRGRPSHTARTATTSAKPARISAAIPRALELESEVVGAGALATPAVFVVSEGDEPAAVKVSVGAGCGGSGTALVGTWIQETVLPAL